MCMCTMYVYICMYRNVCIFIFTYLRTSSSTHTLPPGAKVQLPATYTLDPTSGYYYDSATGLYYDPQSGVSLGSKVSGDAFC